MLVRVGLYDRVVNIDIQTRNIAYIEPDPKDSGPSSGKGYLVYLIDGHSFKINKAGRDKLVEASGGQSEQ